MSNKSVLYLVVGAVLVMLFSNLKDVAVEFIKSTREESHSPIPGLFMMPGMMDGQGSPFGMPQKDDGRTWADNQHLNM